MGIVRVVRAWRASSGGAAGGAERAASPIVEGRVIYFARRTALDRSSTSKSLCIIVYYLSLMVVRGTVMLCKQSSARTISQNKVVGVTYKMAEDKGRYQRPMPQKCSGAIADPAG